MTTSEPSKQKQEHKHKYKYKLRFMPEALAQWHQLDGSFRNNLKKLLAKRLDSPHGPGGELHRPLAGFCKIKLRQQGARLVYSVEDDRLLVTVVAVDRREEGVGCQSAPARLSTAMALYRAVSGKLKK